MQIKDNEIISCDCECPRGSYKCSHAAALFIHAIHNLSRTDMECTWRRQHASLETKSITEMYPPPRKEYKPLKRKVTDADTKWFYEELKKYGKFTGMAWLLSPEPPKKTLPIFTVEDIVSSKEFLDIELKSQEDFLLQKLKVTDEQIKLVNEITKGQRENPSWLMLRKGRLTASNFGSVLNAKKVTQSLLKKVLGEYNLSSVQAINWGINNEAEAIKDFKDVTGLTVEDSGLWLDPSGILGASPDGLIGSNSIIEVKCPYTHRQNTIDEAIQTKQFYINKTKENNYELNKNHIYWHQIQGQLYITKRNMCYLVVWTLKQVIILQITKDEEWEGNIQLLKNFYKNHMIKYMLSE